MTHTNTQDSKHPALRRAAVPVAVAVAAVAGLAVAAAPGWAQDATGAQPGQTQAGQPGATQDRPAGQADRGTMTGAGAGAQAGTVQDPDVHTRDARGTGATAPRTGAAHTGAAHTGAAHTGTQARTAQVERDVHATRAGDLPGITRVESVPDGVEWNAEADYDDFRSVLRDLVNATITDGAFSNMVDRFADADRDRIGEWMQGGVITSDLDAERTERWNAAARSFREAYVARYNQEFDLDQAIAFRTIGVAHGEVRNPQVAQGNWPVGALVGADGTMDARPAGGTIHDRPVHNDDLRGDDLTTPRQPGVAPGTGATGAAGTTTGTTTGTTGTTGTTAGTTGTTAGTTGTTAGTTDTTRTGDGVRGTLDRTGDRIRGTGDRLTGRTATGDGVDLVGVTELDEGREVAVVAVPGPGELPVLHVSMVNETLRGWKVEIPPHVTPDEIYTNVVGRVTYLAQNPQEWPADPASFQEYFAWEILAAVHGADPTPDRGMQQGGMGQPGMQQPGMGQQQPGMGQQPGMQQPGMGQQPGAGQQQPGAGQARPPMPADGQDAPGGE